MFNLFCFYILFIAWCSASTERSWFYENDNIQFRESNNNNNNDKIYFPGRTNELEITQNLNIKQTINEVITNHINDEGEEKKSKTPSRRDPSSRMRVCEMKYAEYIKRIFPNDSDTDNDADDSELNGRVLAEPGEYPHMTALGYPAFNDTMDHRCGGSLISENFVVTAAHCFIGQRPTNVRIGDLNLMIEEKYLEPQIRNIKQIYVHPQYQSNSYYNDIALLELEKEVELTEFVRPIRLWTRSTYPFSLAYAMGYGATDFARERTNRLTNLNMTIVPIDQCNEELPISPENERGVIESQICARDYVLNRDTCQGDSGGPLQLNIRGRRRHNRLHYHLIGITSYGLFCRSGYPSIYTRIYSYLDWIEQIVWRDNFNWL